MTEAKSAALQRLAVPSCYSADLATGTGTDQYCVAAPLEGARTADIGEPAHEVRRDRRDSRCATRRWRRCAGRTDWRRATRAGCFTRSAATACSEATIFDDLAPLLLTPTRISSCCARTASRCSTSRWSAPPRMRSRPCSIAPATARCRRRRCARRHRAAGGVARGEPCRETAIAGRSSVAACCGAGADDPKRLVARGHRARLEREVEGPHRLRLGYSRSRNPLAGSAVLIARSC